TFEWMHEGSTFCRFDLFDFGKPFTNSVDKYNLHSELATHLHTKWVRGSRHHYLCSAAQHSCGVAKRDRMIPGGQSSDSASECITIEIQHHRKSTARLEASRSLKELFFQPELSIMTYRRFDRIVDKLSYRRCDNQIAKPRTIRADCI